MYTYIYNICIRTYKYIHIFIFKCIHYEMLEAKQDLHYEMLEAKLAHCLRLDGDYATPRRGLRAHGQLPVAPARSVRSQDLKVRDSQTIRPYKQQGLRPGD